MSCLRGIAFLLAAAVAASTAWADPIDDYLAAIAKVRSQGAGSSAARAACDRLAAGSVELLPRLLRAMDTDNPVAANWYRSALARIVEREMAQGGAGLPLDELKAAVRDANR